MGAASSGGVGAGVDLKIEVAAEAGVVVFKGANSFGVTPYYF